MRISSKQFIVEEDKKKENGEKSYAVNEGLEARELQSSRLASPSLGAAPFACGANNFPPGASMMVFLHVHGPRRRPRDA
jgi:hypothetical protein